MSNDHHEMEDEDMEEEGQIGSIAWRGMNLRDQIRGKFSDAVELQFETKLTLKSKRSLDVQRHPPRQL
jgi:hypothetical protein